MIDPKNADEDFPQAFGKYELLGRLGDGGMAEVFLARLPGVGGFRKTVVIKRILPHLARQRRFADMFVAEASLAAEVRHRNVVQVYELGRVEGELYMAMEYVEGSDLRVLLGEAGTRGMRIPPWFSVHVVSEVLEALAYAWRLADEHGRARRIVHRDVTPSNIFISDQGEVKLGDFGVARDDTQTRQTRAGQLKGKIAYMAPEQLYALPPDHQVDVFAAGVVLWECLAQKRLFGGRPDIEIMNAISQEPRRAPSNHASDVPSELDNIVLAALEIDKSQRIASAEAFQLRLLETLRRLRPHVRPSDVRAVSLALRGHETASESTPVGHLSGARNPPYDVRPKSRPSFDAADEESARASIPAPQPDAAPLVADLALESDEGTQVQAATAVVASLKNGTPSAQPSVDLDLEALVLDAVSGVEAAPLPTTTVPAEHRLAGLEHRRLLDNSRHLKSERWSFILEQAVYSGPHPFWVRDHEGTEVGPCSFAQALQIIKVESQAGFSASAGVSVVPRDWLPVVTFLGLAGMETLTAARPPALAEAPSWSGTAQEHSLPSVLAALTRARANGRLIVHVDRGQARGFRVIEVGEGRPLHVWASGEDMQIPQLLLTKKLVPERLLPQLMHEVLVQRAELSIVLSKLVGLDLRTYLPTLMKERLVGLFRDGYARFAFNSSASPHRGEPIARTLLAPVSELSFRVVPPGRIAARLSPLLGSALEPTRDFSVMLDALGFTPEQVSIAERLARGRRLSRLLDGSPSAQHRTIRTVAYILVETELLRPG